MIVYNETKDRFLADVFDRDIEEVVLAAYKARTGRSVGASELSSWRSSLTCMAKVLRDDEIPADAGVAIEYGIAQTKKRIDFIVTGQGPDESTNVIIVEMKQWERAKRTDKDGIVVTRMGRGEQEANHPSYQAWSYAALLQGFNEAVYEGSLKLKPCAYLHNYVPDDDISHSCYAHYLDRAPVFLKGEAERNRLRDFIKKHVKTGDRTKAIFRIENGKIRPSKMLVDSIVGMLKGKQEFVLIDDQKIAYESALALAKQASETAKRVVIIEGGPGTGKSVIAINLMVAISKLGLVCKYVSKNAAPRSVYESKLTGSLRRTEITNMFSGSGSFMNSEANVFGALIVDEAHRLNEKSGFYGNEGENQIKEIINAACCSIFFVDEDQRVTLKDIGRKEEIRQWAESLGATVSTLELSSQFRCNGSDGYLAWLDDILGIRDTANYEFDRGDFDFRIIDTPGELRKLIQEKNKVNNKARLVAGYCWKWLSKKDPQAYDVVIPEHDFKMRWNLSEDGSLWIVAPTSVDEIGCIHTSQGLEVDYIGVVVGPDFVVRKDRVVTIPENRASSDKSLSGYKKWLKSDPASANKEADLIIKNTYRTLMTRGMKGCFVYCTDPETAAYFRSRLAKTHVAPSIEGNSATPDLPTQSYVLDNVLPFQRARRTEITPYVDAVPLVELKFAAGALGESQLVDAEHGEWATLPEAFRPRPDMFVAQVLGESMNRRIPNGSWCLFRWNPVGTRQDKVVVAEHRSISDPETGGSYTIKLYKSRKVQNPDGTWRHVELSLRPDSDNPKFHELKFGPESVGDIRIVAELIAVL